MKNALEWCEFLMYYATLENNNKCYCKYVKLAENNELPIVVFRKSK